MDQPRSPTVEQRLSLDADPGETKTRILDAAFRRLTNDGYAALSMREIAKDAGVNHALINYHFRSKDQLVIAVLDEANRQLLERQQRMYAAPGGFAEKWAQARRFYRSDLASGIRARAGRAVGGEPVQPRAAREVRAAPARVEGGGARRRCARRSRQLKANGVKLPAPFSADVIATLDLGVLARHGVRRPDRRDREPDAAPRGARRDRAACSSARRTRAKKRRPRAPGNEPCANRLPEDLIRQGRRTNCPKRRRAGRGGRCRPASVRDRAPGARGLRRARRREELVRGVGRERALDRLRADLPDRAQRRC